MSTVKRATYVYWFPNADAFKTFKQAATEALCTHGMAFHSTFVTHIRNQYATGEVECSVQTRATKEQIDELVAAHGGTEE